MAVAGLIVRLFSCLLVLLFSITAFPSSAFAKSYTMPEVDIQATVGTDASLNVVESRSFDFDGSFSAVWWTFTGLPSNASLQVNAVSLTDADGKAMQLPEVSFVYSWRNAGGPDMDAYSVDKAEDTVYVFFNASDERLVVTLDYTIVNAVQIYEDTAELYWKFISDEWAEASRNVTMRLTLPVPSEETVTPGDNVKAWGHGPLDGNLEFKEDGSLFYQVPYVRGGQFAEARVLFDVAWLTDLDESYHVNKGEYYLETVLEEEQTWADEANQERIQALILVISCALISILALVWAIWAYFKHGKEHTPEFSDLYWRDVPSQQDHPAAIGRLWRWNKKSPNDLTATLMHLSHIGVIRISQGSYQKPGPLGSSKHVDDYYMTRVPSELVKLTHPIDIQTMDLVFNTIGGGADSLWFGSIAKYGKENPKEFIRALDAWQEKVSSEVDRRGFFESKGKIIGTVMQIFAVLLLALSYVASIFLTDFLAMLFSFPVAIALYVISRNMPRRSQEGCTLHAKCKALAELLKDFSLLNERPPTDILVWGEFMVYAFIFGIATQVIDALRLKVPEVFSEAGSVYGTYLPWWFWYGTTYGSSGNVMPSAGDMLKTTINNTISTIQAASSGASGGFSGGGGGGGGFSGGGGGGFGGGGGAR